MCYPAAALERQSGKRDDEQDDGDPRTPFARDRDRLLYSTAFRQLAGKSQVVASTQIGAFHTRLTHSLKVAQLGRRLAEQLRDRAVRNGDCACDKSSTPCAPDPDLVEFACLAHDIGHPPFGHTGERELNQIVKRLVDEAVDQAINDAKREAGESGSDEDDDRYEELRVTVSEAFGGFEGNPQSFRIVTRLSHKAVPVRGASSEAGDSASDGHDYVGLDLTVAAIDAVTKYPWKFDGNSRKPGKWGAYGAQGDPFSDFGTLENARAKTGADPTTGQGADPSFESQLMDWCDDVTYAVHDVEDFYMIGMIPLDELFGYTQMFGHLAPLLAPGDRDGSQSEGSDGAHRDTSQADEDSDSTSMTGDGEPSEALAHYQVGAEWDRFCSFVGEQWKDRPCTADPECSTCGSGNPCKERRQYLNHLRYTLTETAYRMTGFGAKRDSIQGHKWSQRRASDLIKYFAGDNIGYTKQPLLHSGTLLLSQDPDEDERETQIREREDICDLLKKLIWHYVIGSSSLATQQAGQRRIIRELVEGFAADTAQGESELLPGQFAEFIEGGSGCEGIVGHSSSAPPLPRHVSERLRDRCARIRVAADYVASLTEAQAIALHKRLIGSELGGLRDIL